MSRVAVIYEGDKNQLNQSLMSQIDGEPEFYEVSDKNESVAYQKIKKLIQLGLVVTLFFVAPIHASADDTQKKSAKISLETGVTPQIIQASEVAIKQVPQFGFAKGTFIMADDFDEPLDDFKDYMQ